MCSFIIDNYETTDAIELKSGHYNLKGLIYQYCYAWPHCSNFCCNNCGYLLGRHQKFVQVANLTCFGYFLNILMVLLFYTIYVPLKISLTTNMFHFLRLLLLWMCSFKLAVLIISHTINLALYSFLCLLQIQCDY